jgi:hypothetical protein
MSSTSPADTRNILAKLNRLGQALMTGTKQDEALRRFLRRLEEALDESNMAAIVLIETFIIGCEVNARIESEPLQAFVGELNYILLAPLG